MGRQCIGCCVLLALQLVASAHLPIVHSASPTAASWPRGAARAPNCLRRALLHGTHEAGDHAFPGSLPDKQKAEGVTGAGKGCSATGFLSAWQ